MGSYDAGRGSARAGKSRRLFGLKFSSIERAARRALTDSSAARERAELKRARRRERNLRNRVDE